MTEALYDHMFRPWRVVGTTRVRESKTTWWSSPHKWNLEADLAGLRRRVLVDADVFDTIGRNSAELELDEWRRDLFSLIDATPHLDWLLRTRWPENVRRMTPDYEYHACVTGDCQHWYSYECDTNTKRRANVWLGVPVEDQETADERIPKLLSCRDLVPVLWVDADPLVGTINLRQTHRLTQRNEAPLQRPIDLIDLVTIGGETGPNARPCNVDWIRSIVRQCDAAGVACWVNDVASNLYVCIGRHDAGAASYGEKVDCKGNSGFGCERLSELPDDIRVRQLPEVRT